MALNNILNKAIKKLPSFQGNNSITAKTHIRTFNVCITKWYNNANHKDIKMRLFVLALEEDALDWFIERPTNSFDSFDSVIKAFNDKYGDNKEQRHFLKPLAILGKRRMRRSSSLTRNIMILWRVYLNMLNFSRGFF